MPRTLKLHIDLYKEYGERDTRNRCEHNVLSLERGFCFVEAAGVYVRDNIRRPGHI